MRLAVIFCFASLVVASEAGAVGRDAVSLPGCDAISVIDSLREGFGDGERQMQRMAPISQSGYEVGSASSVRYCRGRAKLSNGDWPQVFYVIEQRRTALLPVVRFCLGAPAEAGGSCRGFQPRLAD